MNKENSTTRPLASQFDAASVDSFDDPSGQGQADPPAFLLGGDPRLEDLAPDLKGDTRARIRNGDQHILSSPFPGLDSDLPTRPTPGVE